MSDVIQNVKVRFVAETVDFDKVNAETNKITASHAKLQDQFKQVDSQAKAANKTIQDESAKSTKAAGDTGKSFEGLLDRVKDLSSQIPGAFQVQEVLGFGKAVTTAAAGTGVLSSAMGVLKYAIAATGIGALVIAIVSLAAYFTRTQEGAAKLDGIMRALGAVVNVLAEGVVFLGEKIFSAFEDPKQAIKDLGEFIYNNIINRFKAIIILADAVGEAFKGNFSEAAKLATDGVIQLNTGITNATDKLKELGSEIANAAEEGYKLGIAWHELKEREMEYSIVQNQVSKQISDLTIQAKNRTLAEKDRIDIIDKASKLETEQLAKTTGLARERLALIIRENQVSRDTGQLSEDQRQKEIDQINRITQLEEESILLQERLQNRKDALIEAAITKRNADIKNAATAEENLYKQAYANREIDEKQLQEGLIQTQLDSLNTQKAYLESMGRDTIEIDKSIEDILVKQRQDADKAKLDADKKLSEAQRKEWEEDYAFYSALTKKKLEDDKKAAEQKRQIDEKANQLAVTLVNGFAQLQQQNLANQLLEIQNSQAQELAAAGNNEQAKAVINAKFARETADIKRKQAQTDKDTAIFNIGIATATAVVKQLAATPLPIGAPMVALVAALGAAQLAFAIAKPIPKFNKGTKSVPGIDMGGDSVHALLRPGEGVMPVERMNEYRPAFDAIFDRKIPADLINSIAMNPNILNGRNGGNDSSERLLKSIDSKLDKLKTFEVNMDAKGFKAYLKSEKAKTEIENNYARLT
jgi:hypothetical protein